MALRAGLQWSGAGRSLAATARQVEAWPPLVDGLDSILPRARSRLFAAW